LANARQEWRKRSLFAFKFYHCHVLHIGECSMFRSAGLGGLLLALCFASQVSAIVIANPSVYSGVVSASNPSYDGVNLSGVVEVVIDGFIDCSGSLLSNGDSILTAGHCIVSKYGRALPTSGVVTFMGPNGPVTDTVAAYYVDPAWSGTSTNGGDLAVLRLTNPAPSWATSYSLYTGPTPTGPEVMAGYGLGGDGMDGDGTGEYADFGTLQVGTNEYFENGSYFGWSNSLLLGQFYDASISSTNAFGVADPYSSTDEVDIAPGDSGGPSFYDDELVGVHDIGICEGTDSCDMPPSVGDTLDSYFGEMYGDTSVAANATWIEDQEAPEPVSLSLLGLGLAVLAALRLRGAPTPKPAR
jgi:hypothetical protein